MRTILALLIVVAAIIPRIAYVSDSAEAPVFSDMSDYLQTAANFAQGNGVITDTHYRAYRAPAYPVLMGFCLKGVAPSVQSFRYLQAVLGAVSCALLFYLAHLLGRELTPAPARKSHAILFRYILPTIGGLILAYYDSHIFFTGVLMTETLFTFVLLAWLILLVILYERPSVGPATATAVILGVLALIRPGSLFYLPVLLAVLLLANTPRKNRLRMATLATLLVVVTIAPWTIRNALVLKAFVPISTNGGVNFYVGHNEHFGYNSAKKKEIRENTNLNEVEESRHFLELGLKFVRGHPSEDLNNNFTKLHHLYTTEHRPFPWTYGREFFSSFPTLGWSMPLFAVSVIGLAVCSIRNKLFAATIGGTIFLQTATCVLFFGRTRFRVPLEPLFVLSAVFGAAILGIVIGEQVRIRRSTRTAVR